MDISVDVEIDRPASDVFDYLADGENLPRWMRQFLVVEKVTQGPIGPGTEFRYYDTKDTDSTFEWSVYRPTGHLAWRGEPVRTMPGGSVEPEGSYDLHERDGRTHVEMHMRPQLHGFAKLMGPMMSRGMRKSSSQYIQNLKADLEG
jgi:uncharacterized membrane protein